MKRKIVVADKDESLQYAFATIFSKEHYQILYVSNGKEVEKLAEKVRPDIYIVNVNLPKANGVEVYKKLQKQKLLDGSSFFFLKDKDDTTQLLGYQADGVIEKPINFFRVYETITKEDEVIELTDVVEDEKEGPRRQIRDVLMGDIDAALTRTRKAEEPAPRPMRRRIETRDEAEALQKREKTVEEEIVEEQRKDAAKEEPRTFEDRLGERLRNVVGSMTGTAVVESTGADKVVESGVGGQSELEAQFKTVLQQAMEEAAVKLSVRLAPVLTQYVEDYVKHMLLDITEKVIKEEIDKLLKEST